MMNELVSGMPNDPVEALKYLVNVWDGGISNTEEADTLARFYFLLKKKFNDFGLKMQLPEMEISMYNSLKPNLDKIILDLRILVAEMEMLNLLDINNSCFSISPEKIEEIQLKINELRNMISESSLFDDNHKQRLLTKLEKMQQELHKKITNYDSLLVNTLRLGRTLGKFGKDAVPFTNMVGKMIGYLRECDNELKALPPGEPDYFALPAGEGEGEESN